MEEDSSENEFTASVADVVAEESITLPADLEWYERRFVLPNYRFDAKKPGDRKEKNP